VGNPNPAWLEARKPLIGHWASANAPLGFWAGNAGVANASVLARRQCHPLITPGRGGPPHWSGLATLQWHLPRVPAAAMAAATAAPRGRPRGWRPAPWVRRGQSYPWTCGSAPAARWRAWPAGCRIAGKRRARARRPPVIAAACLAALRPPADPPRPAGPEGRLAACAGYRREACHAIRTLYNKSGVV